MNAKRLSFMNILVQLKKIAIPMIQRDYAQGRIGDGVDMVRSRFLDSLYEAITDKPIILDFVYGSIEKGTMTPLDGQQRLTTLFLLHWYAAKKENIPKDEYKFLSGFSYETRYSSREFCGELLDYTPSWFLSGNKDHPPLSSDIQDQAWFPFDWKNDPTISSMLVMLDAIDGRFKDAPDIWERLKNNAITFYFLPIKDMGLTDELYIKMNSRGKPLTLFEHFKAGLEREIKTLDEKTGQDAASRIMKKIDGGWTDLLWDYRDSGNGVPEDDVVDDEFLRYFKFVCDIICYRDGNSPEEGDAFDLLGRYFSAKAEVGNPSENITTLESFFDCWRDIKGYSDPAKFLGSFMSHTHGQGKIIVASWNKINIFEDCLHAYSDESGRTRQFPLNRLVLLYAITVYLQHQSEVDYADFVRRIRIVNNLIQNSEDEVSDRTDRNRMPAIIKTVDWIILHGTIDGSIGNSFNANQLQEEKEKIGFLVDNPTRAEELFELEDHEILKGQIGIIGLDNLASGPRFASLFGCSWDKVDCALMTIGNYGQKERNKWRYQFGSASKDHKSAWEELFHKSANAGFDKTKEILAKLLATNQRFDDSILESIVNAYITRCERESLYPWNYYYVKYPAFRPGSYGKMSNYDAENKPYMYSVMQTKARGSANTYMPYLKEADEAHLEWHWQWQCLLCKDVYIVCENNSYEVYKKEGDPYFERQSLEDTVDIPHDEHDIDTEDRIVRLKEYLKTRNLTQPSA